MTLRIPQDLERALLWLVTAYRVFGAAWMTLLGSLVLASDQEPASRPGWVVTALAVVVVWTLVTVIAALRATHVASTWGFVGVDIAIGVFAVFASVFAESINFTGGYALAPIFGSVYAKGSAGGVIAAAAMTAAALARVPALSFDLPNSVSVAISYLFSAAAAIGAASVLRSSERRRLTAEEALLSEQAARARADERAEVAAHLHDSVLQTLALIQRDSTASDPVRGLARSQERELRTWLYHAEQASELGFREAVTAMAAEIEDLGTSHVECVVVGDAPMTERLQALVRAGREAVLNAAKHAGAASVSVYAETEPEETVLYIKDRGSGFDAAAVPDDRRGIADSIVGRMERHGGTVTIDSAPGSGTEVRLTMPAKGTSDE